MSDGNLGILDLLFATQFYYNIYQQNTTNEQEGIIQDSLIEITKEINRTNELLEQLIKLNGGTIDVK